MRVSLAFNYRVNQARSSISKFFTETELASLLKIKDAEKYAYGFEVLEGLDEKRKKKPQSKGDRYHTKVFGQALRYGKYAVVAACTNSGHSAGKTASQALDLALNQWKAFEAWAEHRPSNSSYRSNSAFDYVNYYKGSTINDDLQRYNFSF